MWDASLGITNQKNFEMAEKVISANSNIILKVGRGGATITKLSQPNQIMKYWVVLTSANIFISYVGHFFTANRKYLSGLQTTTSYTNQTN